jgi:FtsZ-binding cell division protein ZapB
MTQKALTKANYARHIGKSRQYVNELVRNGRTVQNANGLILVAETDALVFETSDPSKVGVVERHANERNEKQNAPVADVSEMDLARDEIGKQASGIFQQSKALREKYNALLSKLEYEKATAKLLAIEDVNRAIYAAANTVRTRLESLPDRFAVQFAAETSSERIKSEMTETIEQLLTEMSRQFKKIATEHHEPATN